ncbi:hypothetical protein [Sphingobacterium pedocola]|uniref:Uncharacterized protein n=1 Tax=Sphingobacterium pedocola TaxID=2082722 RepID=A0ABR9T543_9SPHI|nr:hypothetical protein [Sphingobacterium pedocola]MBE8720463.1 hypothetical protein [Sphingobacterium pedocola]
MIYRSNGDIKEELAWTKVSHSYKEASLRTFVAQMSRWHGFTVKDMNCIPKDGRINASICYKSSNEEVFAAIRKAGITLSLHR